MLSKFLRPQDIIKSEGGYKAPSTEGGALDAPYLDLPMGSTPKSVVTDLEGEAFPPYFSMRALIQGNPAPPLKTTLQMIREGETQNPYDLDSLETLDHSQAELSRYGRHSSVRLLWQGTVFIRTFEGSSLLPSVYTLSIPQKACVFEKKFTLQDREIILEHKDFIESRWVTRLGEMGFAETGMVLIHALGGYYKPGITALDQVEQCYFYLGYQEGQVLPCFQTGSYWKNLGCTLKNGGACDAENRVRFVDAPCLNQEISLGKELEQGHVTLRLHNQECEEDMVYASYGYTQTDRAATTVDIHFKLHRTSLGESHDTDLTTY